MSQKPLSPELFKEVYSRVPRLCVELIIKTPQGIVLTLRALPTWNNQWHIPGGTVHYGETVVDALHRVAAEEVGIPITVEKLLGYIEYPSEEKERGFGNSIGIAFLCGSESTTFKEPDEEASAIKAFTILPDTIIEEQRVFLESHSDWQ